MARVTLVTDIGDRDHTELPLLRSLRRQRDTEWELLVRCSVAAPRSDRRVRLVVDPQADLGRLLAGTDAEWVGIVGADDTLEPDALARLGDVGDDVDFAYSDEDELPFGEARRFPHFKPGWSPDRLRVQPYTGRLALARRTRVADVVGTPLSQTEAEHDLALRVTERARRVVHVPEILSHRSTAPAEPADGGAERARVVGAHLARTGFPATAEVADHATGRVRLRPALRSTPRVSIVIPTAGTIRMVRGAPTTLVVNCVQSVLTRSTYENFEIVCVVDAATPDTTRRALEGAGGERIRLVEYREEFHFARKINRGALASDGELLLLLNDDVEVVTPDWIESLASYALQPGVGAVGAKLRFGDGRLQHAGIIAAGRGGPGHPYYGFPGDTPGYDDNLLVPGNYLAVTAACTMTPRAAFEAVGGFSAVFPVNYNDVDYCLKLHARGLRSVFDPEAQLYHYEGSSRVALTPSAREVELLVARWGRVLERDPYYNRNLLPSTDFRPPVIPREGAA